MGLRYVVVTSVTRDDLDDGGARFFAETIEQIRRKLPGARVEVLIPDFKGDSDALHTVLRARPDVLNHNLETVPRLYPTVRPEARYRRSLALLRRVHEAETPSQPKSGLMLGLGETPEEIREALADLLDAGCKIVTFGQYLQPSEHQLPVERFVPPEEFDHWHEAALRMGFSAVASGPFVRSSYDAQGLYRAGHGSTRR
jgi:lipoic acid synthetase